MPRYRYPNTQVRPSDMLRAQEMQNRQARFEQAQAFREDKQDDLMENAEAGRESRFDVSNRGRFGSTFNQGLDIQQKNWERSGAIGQFVPDADAAGRLAQSQQAQYERYNATDAIARRQSYGNYLKGRFAGMSDLDLMPGDDLDPAEAFERSREWDRRQGKAIDAPSTWEDSGPPLPVSEVERLRDPSKRVMLSQMIQDPMLTAQEFAQVSPGQSYEQYKALYNWAAARGPEGLMAEDRPSPRALKDVAYDAVQQLKGRQFTPEGQAMADQMISDLVSINRERQRGNINPSGHEQAIQQWLKNYKASQKMLDSMVQKPRTAKDDWSDSIVEDPKTGKRWQRSIRGGSPKFDPIDDDGSKVDFNKEYKETYNRMLDEREQKLLGEYNQRKAAHAAKYANSAKKPEFAEAQPVAPAPTPNEVFTEMAQQAKRISEHEAFMATKPAGFTSPWPGPKGASPGQPASPVAPQSPMAAPTAADFAGSDQPVTGPELGVPAATEPVAQEAGAGDFSGDPVAPAVPAVPATPASSSQYVFEIEGKQYTVPAEKDGRRLSEDEARIDAAMMAGRQRSTGASPKGGSIDIGVLPPEEAIAVENARNVLANIMQDPARARDPKFREEVRKAREVLRRYAK